MHKVVCAGSEDIYSAQAFAADYLADEQIAFG